MLTGRRNAYFALPSRSRKSPGRLGRLVVPFGYLVGFQAHFAAAALAGLLFVAAMAAFYGVMRFVEIHDLWNPALTRELNNWRGRNRKLHQGAVHRSLRFERS